MDTDIYSLYTFLLSVLQRRIFMHNFCKHTLFINGMIFALAEKHQTETTRLTFLIIFTIKDSPQWLIFCVNVIVLSISKC